MNQIEIWGTQYQRIDTITYNSYAYTEVFCHDDVIIMIDYNICDAKEFFDYSLLTSTQNKYMHLYKKVYRFYYRSNIMEVIRDTVMNLQMDFQLNSLHNREYVMDNTPVEENFENNFEKVFGFDSLQLLNKEYSISDPYGNTYDLDYFMENDCQKIGVEENGVQYHHPQIIGEQRYIHQLQKQNACTQQNIKLFRFSSQDCQFTDRLQDDMKRYFHNVVETGKRKVIKATRTFALYEHQSEYLHDFVEKRQQGIKSCLVVLPTASGKSKIIEEDLKTYFAKDANTKVLVLAPTTTIVSDWIQRLQAIFNVSIGSKQDCQIAVCTYQAMNRSYRRIPSNYYDYIVIDEAHHAVAPMLKRTIQYFEPDFLVGLTATDERLDHQKLETVFGQYESHLSLEEAMQAGIVANARVFRIESNIDLSEVRFNGKDYVNADLEKSIRVNSRNELIADVLLQYFNEGILAQKQGVIFCVNQAHAKEMAQLLNANGISASSMTSNDKNRDQIFESFKKKDIRFLCTCNMLSEGWDYPELGILVMARPTMSKVLYLQQLGRGLRKAEHKECVYVIDVVDEYGALIRPWSMNALFHNPYYVPFGEILHRNYHLGDMIIVDGLVERIENIQEIDIHTFEEKYGDYLTHLQLARECFVDDNTIKNWVRKKRITPDNTITFGNKNLYLFSKENVERIFQTLHIKKHSEETIRQDFYDFIAQKDYSCSYKMIFMLSLLKHVTINGEADMDDVLHDYKQFYLDRIHLHMTIDKATCKYNEENLNDKTFIKRNMLTNPFEKFERKRFLYQCKDLNKLAFHPALWEKLTKEDLRGLQQTFYEHLQEYYKDMDGVQNIDYLIGG